LLAILDTSVPTYERKENDTMTWSETDLLWTIVRTLEELNETKIGMTKETLQSQATLEQSYELVMQHLKQQGMFAPTAEIDQIKAMVDTFKASIHAHTHYQPQGHINAQIVLFRAQEQPENRVQSEDWDWSQYTSGKVNVEWIPGTHFTMLNEPHVKTLAAQLHTHLLSSTHTTNNSQ
jgi:thioesterase domain-containing protein